MSDEKKSIYERYNVYCPFQECRQKKHPCPDCGFCQFCSDARCGECLERQKAQIGKTVPEPGQTPRPSETPIPQESLPEPRPRPPGKKGG